MKYIFIAGAPGSKWSSVTLNLYYSPDIDHSDYSEARTYWHDAPGKLMLMHTGAYFDPGMEFGDFFNNIERYSKKECESEFNRPFNGTGVRIIKSHVFCEKIDFLRDNWPDCPIITVHRANDACLGWWVRCGEFNITYPLYHKYFKNLPTMAKIIDKENLCLTKSLEKYQHTSAVSNRDLASVLGIKSPPDEYYQDYQASDITVRIIK
jgi:hypothetical protein